MANHSMLHAASDVASCADKPLRSHEAIAEAWQADEELAIWLTGFFALGGIFLSWIVLRDRGAT